MRRVKTIAILVLLVILATSLYLGVSGQLGCCDPPAFPVGYAHFAPNSPVTVTISSAFTPTEREDIISAFQDWNSHRTVNGTNIEFGPFLTGETPILQSGHQFVGYDATSTAGAVNRVNSAGYARMYISSFIRNCTPSGCRSLNKGRHSTRNRTCALFGQFYNLSRG